MRESIDRMTTSTLGRAAVLGLLLVTVLVGCGDEPDSTTVSDPGESGSTTPTPMPTEITGSPAASAVPTDGGPVQFRVVIATDRAPAPDSLIKQQFDNLNCAVQAEPIESDATAYLCDGAGVKYALEPAVIIGGVASAQAGLPQGTSTWVVSVQLEPEAAAQMTDLSSQLAAREGQLAIVLGGEVVSAPSFMGPVPAGQLELSGDFDEASATAIAAALSTD